MILDISIHELAKMTFEDAIKNTKYGDTIIYHVGQYAGGKHKYAALEAAEKGFVSLVQKRKGRGLFEYTAQRSKKHAG
tara:strand:- start:409 stop:642 length:234 start_codon:yes stop_codon:yes gene_type:complete